jgi:predicted nucleic acid-binding protein
VPVVDAWLAATARVHGLTLVTRNVRDFAGLRVRLLNPFTAPTPGR